ncbi:hypothetical protein CEE44_00090 [Candidatus Woesearchaeota archaeon B3_Woes]|nr:MAG: hypothetical protein CEE44_00090 [Candidatus Woesearchaeota archaeon B3_Woes]
MTKLVFIAHPISGNIKDNVKNILEICKKVHTKDIIPIAPYLTAFQYLDNEIKDDKERGVQANEEFFKRKIIDELWLCGDKISKGMREEIKLSKENNIPIKFYNKELEKEL